MISDTPFPTFPEGFLFISKYPYPGLPPRVQSNKVPSYNKNSGFYYYLLICEIHFSLPPGGRLG